MASPESRDGLRVESEDEVLVGAENSAFSRMRARIAGRRKRIPRRVARLVRRAGVIVLALAIAVSVYIDSRSQNDGRQFAIDVVAADFKVSPIGGGVDTTLTVANPTKAPINVVSAALGGIGVQGTGTATRSIGLTIEPRGRRTLTLHSDFDCLAGEPATATTVQFTGIGADGKPRTTTSSIPIDRAFDSRIAPIRDAVCQIPYPLAYATVTYIGIVPAANPALKVFSMAIDVSVNRAYQTAPVVVTDLRSDLSGTVNDVRDTNVTITPGTPTRLILDWTVTDCTAVPNYAGIPTVIVTAVDPRATETWRYVLGSRYDADLAAQIARACP